MPIDAADHRAADAIAQRRKPAHRVRPGQHEPRERAGDQAPDGAIREIRNHGSRP